MHSLPMESAVSEAKQQVVNSRPLEWHDDAWVPVLVHDGEETCDAEGETCGGNGEEQEPESDGAE